MRCILVLTILLAAILRLGAASSPLDVARDDPELVEGSEQAAGLDQTVNTPPAAPPASRLAALVDRYSADRSSIVRRYTAEYSPERYARLTRFYKEWQQELAKAPFDRLDVEGRIDHVALTARLEYELRLLAREQAWVNETAALLPFAKAITDLVEARGRLDPIDPRNAATTLEQINRDLEAAIKRIDTARSTSGTNGTSGTPGTLEKISAFRATDILTSYKNSLQEWSRFYSGYDPMFTWWTSNPYAKVDKALAAYIRALREKVVGYKEGEDEPIVGNPIGRAGLVEDLASEFVPYTPEELLKIAEREFAWCDREMLKASRDMGFGDDWKAALEKVKTLHVPPGKQTDLVRDLAREAEDYVEKRNLITIPPLAKEDWRMTMMSPERQKVAPFFLGGEQIIVSYPTDTMDHDDKMMSMRGNNIHFSRSTVFHELNPGHHLQQFMTARYNTHRRAFGTPFWTEGWALYWEMLLWDDGFPQTPENRVGMLFWRMHRQARIIFSLRFHLGEWSPQQAIDFLVDRVGHERANAEAEVRRSFNGTYPPLYQLAYMMGGLQFRAMHAELVQSGKMTNRQFHDTIMQTGSMPVELVRASLTKQQLPAGFKTTWRFAG
jgi:uncharacterized protein (DUF885 family)